MQQGTDSIAGADSELDSDRRALLAALLLLVALGSAWIGVFLRYEEQPRRSILLIGACMAVFAMLAFKLRQRMLAVQTGARITVAVLGVLLVLREITAFFFFRTRWALICTSKSLRASSTSARCTCC